MPPATCTTPAAPATKDELVCVPTAVFRTLTSYRLLGPHLRMSSWWRDLQDSVDAALLRAAGGDTSGGRETSPSMEELMRRWEEAHAGC